MTNGIQNAQRPPADPKTVAVSGPDPASGSPQPATSAVASCPSTGARKTSKVHVVLVVQPGRKYQLETSCNLVNWAPAGSPFEGQDELLMREFDIDLEGRYFRLSEVP